MQSDFLHCWDTFSFIHLTNLFRNPVVHFLVGGNWRSTLSFSDIVSFIALLPSVAFHPWWISFFIIQCSEREISFLNFLSFQEIPLSLKYFCFKNLKKCGYSSHRYFHSKCLLYCFSNCDKGTYFKIIGSLKHPCEAIFSL